MFFGYYEQGWGELYFEATIHPFRLMLSERIPEVFWSSLN